MTFDKNLMAEMLEAAEKKAQETVSLLNKYYISPDWYVERKAWRPGENHGSRS